jgi:hypothetical protein
LGKVSSKVNAHKLAWNPRHGQSPDLHDTYNFPWKTDGQNKRFAKKEPAVGKFWDFQILYTEKQHLVNYNVMSKLMFTETKHAKYNSHMNLCAPVSVLDKGIDLLPLPDLQNAYEVQRRPEFLVSTATCHYTTVTSNMLFNCIKIERSH